MKATTLTAVFAMTTVLVICHPVMADDNYTVSPGNQDTTYKSGQEKERPNTSDTTKPPKDDDSHDRSENDAGHGKSDTKDVLIDQSTWKNRDKPAFIPPTR